MISSYKATTTFSSPPLPLSIPLFFLKQFCVQGHQEKLNLRHFLAKKSQICVFILDKLIKTFSVIQR